MPKATKLKARLIGKDKIGYQHFRIYEIMVWVNEDATFTIESISGRYQYSSLTDFLNDWQVVYRSEGNEDAAAE